ncbi:MAG: AAA family ATPase [Bacilli bacterium]|nr:AAA family ATPase [Bacilli bacterium]
MKRKYLDDLIKWNADPQRKPLMVWGARQVGKSYLIEELFAKVYYKDRYKRIDCSDDSDFVDYVFNNDKLSKVLEYIEIKYDFKPDKNHLLIFDEAQECLPIVKMMKHFCEQRRDIPVIVTGSLVRLKILRDAHKRGGYANNTKFLFPVGKINQLYMYPLSFDEFLMNFNNKAYEYLKRTYKNNEQIDFLMHKDLIDMFNDYLFVGGMPEVVDTFLNNQQNRPEAFEKVVAKTKEIYDDYLADMDLYQASPESIIRSRSIYKDIYKQLNKENKNFKFSLTENGAKSRDMANPIGWLVTAKVVNQSFLLKEKVTSPLIKDEDSLMRLYLSDIGMFTYQSGLNAKTFLSNKDNALSGIFYETFVSTELISRGFELFYWKGKRDSELEFVVNVGTRIIPIDVKKGKDKMSSLEEFRQHNKKDIAIKISSNQYGYDKQQKLLTVPFYYVSFLLDDLQKGAIIEE